MLNIGSADSDSVDPVDDTCSGAGCAEGSFAAPEREFSQSHTAAI